MAPELSSNWKRLQAKLQASKPATSSKPKDSTEDQASLKRKRSFKTSDKSTNAPRHSLNGTGKSAPHKSPASRKRQKMEEPASVGASIKQHNVKTLSRSVSTPQLKRTPLLTTEEDAAVADDILTPHPDFPDIENEGVSEKALPGKYVALDCEMVGVGPEPNRDSALARVSLVNYHGHQVYDSYVQMLPKVEVTDYRTAVSGIEPKHLHKDVARTFDEVRSDLKILLGGRILVGHAVKNDLDVLILKHDKRLIRDTSKFSKFRQLATKAGWTPGLKMLTQKLLGVEIQTGAHSSVEDARATMALFRLEKEEFENEIRQKYGNVRLPTAAAEPEADGEGEEKKKRNRKKSKKKNKH
ncbi:ribonuclease H-like domain-containing protein [Boeremia exigua]|uniref:ribonuclease H-like domain-containing protein n=1 Tax=Boeremia exigua TaxID=749465 RepID=UPI001E8D0AA1|nr:ribonuclease H-like domain-containing protein [Boeremia exigua]KAH6614141.1 ribonuclease H-like domain-containing protein [Boeremia exigua]